MRDIGCHYVTSAGEFRRRKTMEKGPLILPAKVARAFTESARQAVPVVLEKIILAALAVFSPDKPCSIQARDRKACKKSNSGIYRKHVEQKTEHHETGRKKGSGIHGTPEAKTDAGKQGLPEPQRTNQGKGHNYDKKPL